MIKSIRKFISLVIAIAFLCNDIAFAGGNNMLAPANHTGEISQILPPDLNALWETFCGEPYKLTSEEVERLRAYIREHWPEFSDSTRMVFRRLMGSEAIVPKKYGGTHRAHSWTLPPVLPVMPLGIFAFIGALMWQSMPSIEYIKQVGEYIGIKAGVYYDSLKKKLLSMDRYDVIFILLGIGICYLIYKFWLYDYVHKPNINEITNAIAMIGGLKKKGDIHKRVQFEGTSDSHKRKVIYKTIGRIAQSEQDFWDMADGEIIKMIQGLLPTAEDKMIQEELWGYRRDANKDGVEGGQKKIIIETGDWIILNTEDLREYGKGLVVGMDEKSDILLVYFPSVEYGRKVKRFALESVKEAIEKTERDESVNDKEIETAMDCEEVLRMREAKLAEEAKKARRFRNEGQIPANREPESEQLAEEPGTAVDLRNEEKKDTGSNEQDGTKSPDPIQESIIDAVNPASEVKPIQPLPEELDTKYGIRLIEAMVQYSKFADRGITTVPFLMRSTSNIGCGCFEFKIFIGGKLNRMRLTSRKLKPHTLYKIEFLFSEKLGRWICSAYEVNEGEVCSPAPALKFTVIGLKDRILTSERYGRIRFHILNEEELVRVRRDDLEGERVFAGPEPAEAESAAVTAEPQSLPLTPTLSPIGGEDKDVSSPTHAPRGYHGGEGVQGTGEGVVPAVPASEPLPEPEPEAVEAAAAETRREEEVDTILGKQELMSMIVENRFEDPGFKPKPFTITSEHDELFGVTQILFGNVKDTRYSAVIMNLKLRPATRYRIKYHFNSWLKKWVCFVCEIMDDGTISEPFMAFTGKVRDNYTHLVNIPSSQFRACLRDMERDQRIVKGPIKRILPAAGTMSEEPKSDLPKTQPRPESKSPESVPLSLSAVPAAEPAPVVKIGVTPFPALSAEPAQRAPEQEPEFETQQEPPKSEKLEIGMKIIVRDGSIMQRRGIGVVVGFKETSSGDDTVLVRFEGGGRPVQILLTYLEGKVKIVKEPKPSTQEPVPAPAPTAESVSAPEPAAVEPMAPAHAEGRVYDVLKGMFGTEDMNVILKYIHNGGITLTELWELLNVFSEEPVSEKEIAEFLNPFYANGDIFKQGRGKVAGLNEANPFAGQVRQRLIDYFNTAIPRGEIERLTRQNIRFQDVLAKYPYVATQCVGGLRHYKFCIGEVGILAITLQQRFGSIHKAMESAFPELDCRTYFGTKPNIWDRVPVVTRRGFIEMLLKELEEIRQAIKSGKKDNKYPQELMQRRSIKRLAALERPVRVCDLQMGIFLIKIGKIPKGLLNRFYIFYIKKRQYDKKFRLTCVDFLLQELGFTEEVAVRSHRFRKDLRDGLEDALKDAGYEPKKIKQIIYKGLARIDNSGVMHFEDDRVFEIAAGVINSLCEKRGENAVTLDQVKAVAEYHERIHRLFKVKGNREIIDRVKTGLKRIGGGKRLAGYFKNQYEYDLEKQEDIAVEELIASYWTETLLMNNLELLDDSGNLIDIKIIDREISNIIEQCSSGLIGQIDIEGLIFGKTLVRLIEIRRKRKGISSSVQNSPVELPVVPLAKKERHKKEPPRHESPRRGDNRNPRQEQPPVPEMGTDTKRDEAGKEGITVGDLIRIADEEYGLHFRMAERLGIEREALEIMLKKMGLLEQVGTIKGRRLRKLLEEHNRSIEYASDTIDVSKKHFIEMLESMAIYAEIVESRRRYLLSLRLEGLNMPEIGRGAKFILAGREDLGVGRILAIEGGSIVMVRFENCKRCSRVNYADLLTNGRKIRKEGMDETHRDYSWMLPPVLPVMPLGMFVFIGALMWQSMPSIKYIKQVGGYIGIKAGVYYDSLKKKLLSIDRYDLIFILLGIGICYLIYKFWLYDYVHKPNINEVTNAIAMIGGLKKIGGKGKNIRRKPSIPVRQSEGTSEQHKRKMIYKTIEHIAQSEQDFGDMPDSEVIEMVQDLLPRAEVEMIQEELERYRKDAEKDGVKGRQKRIIINPGDWIILNTEDFRKCGKGLVVGMDKRDNILLVYFPSVQYGRKVKRFVLDQVRCVIKKTERDESVSDIEVQAAMNDDEVLGMREARLAREAKKSIELKDEERIAHPLRPMPRAGTSRGRARARVRGLEQPSTQLSTVPAVSVPVPLPAVERLLRAARMPKTPPETEKPDSIRRCNAIEKIYPVLMERIRGVKPDFSIGVDVLQDAVIAGRFPKNWPGLVSATRADGTIDENDFDLISNIGRIVDECASGGHLSSEDRALLTEIISIRCLIDRAKDKKRRRLADILEKKLRVGCAVGEEDACVRESV